MALDAHQKHCPDTKASSAPLPTPPSPTQTISIISIITLNEPLCYLITVYNDSW